MVILDHEWNSVEDSLPAKFGQTYLVKDKTGRVFAARLYSVRTIEYSPPAKVVACWRECDTYGPYPIDITHWVSFPSVRRL